jgi:1,4-alpha-glucan branching enzyme
MQQTKPEAKRDATATSTDSSTDSSTLTEHDIYLFKEGRHNRLYEKLGSHLTSVAGSRGARFAVWAPEAVAVSVIGDFNKWSTAANPLNLRPDGSGIFDGFIPDLEPGAVYKYHIVSSHRGYTVDKGDPFAFAWETAPRTASVVTDLSYDWSDADWMASRASRGGLDAPFSIYEVHLGSWRRRPDEDNRSLTYRELADQLPEYVKKMGYTHVELLPVMEHPFYGSWGYQIIGYYAPTSRYGTPQDFMYLIDRLHQHGIGVILDWVPSHFPSDEHGPVYFDGTHLYEHADPRKGFHPDWDSYIFNYGRVEVEAFLVSNALYWLDKYHADALRVDAVASMLYLDYSRKPGEWIPNKFGGRENLEAIEFLRRFNEAVYKFYPDVQTIAEESTAWPMVSRPLYIGGLGFGMKWNMGWMHDVLSYLSHDPVHRKYYHSQLTFSIWYAFSENFVLSLSHDEVVYGKGSLLGKMPGDDWQRHANLRLLFGYMYGHPGKKLMFMGGEFGQEREWNHDRSLDWHQVEEPLHKGVQRWVSELNHLYKSSPPLYELDFQPEGFEWVDFHDADRSVISFVRKGKSTKDIILVVCNFTPVPRYNYRVGVPEPGLWREVLNSDAKEYGGAGFGNLGGMEATPVTSHGRPYSVSLTVPSLATLFFKWEAPADETGKALS